MLDVHPAHHSATTWRDFFVHIATIVLGLLIAIGLEQTVEAIHHRHQRAELTEQMRVEAKSNLPLIRESIARLQVQAGYMQALEDALLAGKVSGADVEVHGVPPPVGSNLYISPSRATWPNAQSAGLAALLPAGQAELYARLDFITAGEIGADEDLHEKVRTLLSECTRAHYDHTTSAVSAITVVHRDDLLFQLEQAKGSFHKIDAYLGLVEGGDEAIVGGARSLDEMYHYQNAALGRIHLPDTNFYGSSPKIESNEIPTQPIGPE
ncbi:MAG: hypothetical protein ACRD3K_07360 [Edaphobacter sp.]